MDLVERCQIVGKCLGAWPLPGAVLLVFLIFLVEGVALSPRTLTAQEGPRTIEVTLGTMADLVMSSSFSVRRLRLDVERERENLRAQRARLRSSVDLDLTVPAFRMTSEPRWNSDLQRNEIIQENTRRWEGELSIRQPLILFGYPTNGYFSFNNRVYRYNQIDDEGHSGVEYYNRYYISYTQPLFQANRLKNDLEQAELGLREARLEFNSDIVGILSAVSEGYHELLDEYYTRSIRRDMVAHLERALGIAHELARSDSVRSMDVSQIQIELANAREQLQGAESSVRLLSSYVKQELGLAETDSIAFQPEFRLDPVPIDMGQAIQFATELTPRLRQLDIGLRNRQIWLDETRSRGGFRVYLNMSYGRERLDPHFDRLWVHPENSYTINIRAFLPLWDWGGRKSRVKATEVALEQTRLRIEEAELDIVSGVRNEVLNVRDRENRTLSMRDNLALARQVAETGFQQYQDGAITVQDLLLSLRRESDTAENFLEAYVAWRESLTRLQSRTFYSFERGEPVMEWIAAEGWIEDMEEEELER
jgi:outer membrane protein TolC